MILDELFQIQKIMEEKIREISNMEEDALGKENIFELRFLALNVKIGELANMTKCYKYTKIINDIPKQKKMIRYIDALKFILSIGNTYDFNIINESVINYEYNDNIIEVFSSIFSEIEKMKNLLKRDDYINGLQSYIRLFGLYLNLGKILELNFQEVYDYYQKHYSEILPLHVKRKRRV